MTVAEASDLVWLIESVRLVAHFTGTVAYQARQATPWRFPLRIGSYRMSRAARCNPSSSQDSIVRPGDQR
jgi:hypothetical protein